MLALQQARAECGLVAGKQDVRRGLEHKRVHVEEGVAPCVHEHCVWWCGVQPSVSGAVGNWWRHSSASARISTLQRITSHRTTVTRVPVLGGGEAEDVVDALPGCAEDSGHDDGMLSITEALYLTPCTSHSYGFDTPRSVLSAEPCGNRYACSGCCGRMWLDGSFGPGIRSTGADAASCTSTSSTSCNVRYCDWTY